MRAQLTPASLGPRGDARRYPPKPPSANMTTDVARISRPPGFDMAYRPAEALFGPPLSYRVPSLLYLALALGVGAMVLLAERSAPGTWLRDTFVVADTYRVISSRTLALLLLLSALTAVMRGSMRGVRVRGDGVECREITGLIWPHIRRIRWAQIDTIRLDATHSIGFDLWDGSRTELPRVRDRAGLAAALERVAAAHAIPVRGGSGLLDYPDQGEYEAAARQRDEAPKRRRGAA